MPKKLTREEFIRRANEIHKGRYDYSKVEYVNSYTKVCIICPEHGAFMQTPTIHLGGHGCRKCYDESLTGKNKYDRQSFTANSIKNRVTTLCMDACFVAARSRKPQNNSLKMLGVLMAINTIIHW